MKYLELILYKSYSDIKTEVARAYLGLIWWFLEPIMFLGVFFLVFGLGLRLGGPRMVVFFLVGLVVWKWFHGCVNRAGRVLYANKGIIDQLYIPKYVFILSLLLTVTFKAALLFLTLFASFFLVGVTPAMSWVWFPFIVGLQLMLQYGLMCIVAVMTSLAEDLILLINNMLMMMFFLSGVFFDISTFSKEVQSIFRINPVAVLIENYRLVLIEGLLPRHELFTLMLPETAAIFFLGIVLISYFDRTIPKLLN